MPGPFSIRRPAAWAAGAACSLALAGCAGLSLLDEIVFAPRVPGLAADQPWISMPVGAWVVEGATVPVAVSACFAETCGPRGLVGLFRSRGSDAARDAAALRDADGLVRALASRAAGRSRSGAVAASEPRRYGRFAGLAVRIARPDGSRPAFGVALGRPEAGTLTLLVVVAETAEAADRLARDVATALG